VTKAREDVRQREVEEFERAEAPLVQALRAAGADGSSVWDFVNAKARYPQLIPTLFAQLDGPHPEKVGEGIAKAVAVPESRPWWNEPVNPYLAETDNSSDGMKWATPARGPRWRSWPATPIWRRMYVA
jgi:hypothetical protein